MEMDFSNRFVSECREYSTYIKHVAAPLFRKSINVKGKEINGEILLCGLGFYELFINGTKITKGYLAPYISNSDHLVYYDHYDITQYLKQGENVIGIMLGDGFQNGKTKVWDFMNNIFNSAPKLALSFRVVCDDKEQEYDAMDFRCKKGPIWFNDLRSGTFFDKRLEEKGWNEPGYIEDATWHKPIAVERPRGKAKICNAEPIIVKKELAPVAIRKGKLVPYKARKDVYEGLYGKGPEELQVAEEGGWIYDFGENNAGIFRLRIKGHKGQRIDIQCAEQLSEGGLDFNNINFYPDGYSQRDIYVVGSNEVEIFEPMFTYHGYRYLYISGIEESQATPDLLTYLVMSSDLPQRGSFVCSDETANRIYEMCLRSDRSNFYYFPTDCPHREKNGWTGDAQVSAEHMILTAGVENSFREWLNNIRAAQNEEGALPGIVPTGSWGYVWGNGPAWDKVIFELPYIVYKYRGETEIIRENAHSMLRYLEYISKKRDKRGIISIGLGDWVPVDRKASDYQVPLGFTDSVMVYQMCRQAEEMFKAIGLSVHTTFVRQLGQELLRDIRKEYIDFNKMLIKSSCQSAQAIGIYYDIFEQAEKQEAFKRLLEIIGRDGKKITSGYLGMRVVFHVLAEFGEGELAYKMITSTEYPSYGYFVNKGETTLPEQILPDEQRRRLSLNHHFLGDVVNWYMRYPGGINVLSSKRVMIKPEFINKLDFVDAFHQMPSGRIGVSWHRENGKILLEVVCPTDVECEIVLPVNYIFEVNGNSWEKAGSSHHVIVQCET